MKRILTILMSAIMVLSMMPAMAFAAGENVARIGDKEYATLQAAIENAKSNDTITLLKNVTISNTITISGKDVVINLNGCVIEDALEGVPTSEADDIYMGRVFRVCDGSKLTVDGTTPNSGMSIPDTSISSGFFAVDMGGSLMLNGGSYSGNTKSYYQNSSVKNGSGNLIGIFDQDESGIKNSEITLIDLYVSTNYSVLDTLDTIQTNNILTVNVDGGNYYNTSAYTFHIDSFSICPVNFNDVSAVVDGAKPIVELDGSKGTFENCYFEVKEPNNNNFSDSAIFLGYDGTATVVSGDYKSVGTALYIGTTGGEFNIEGGTFVGNKNCVKVDATSGCESTINISSGSFEGNLTKGNGKGTETINVIGGLFTTDPTQYVPSGYIVNNQNGKYIVTETPKVAQIGEVKYETVSDALEASKAGDTVTLLDNIGLTNKVTIDKAITLEGNGKTISVADGLENDHLILMTAGATVKNVTLDSNKKAKGIQVYSNNTPVEVSFDNVSFKNSAGSGLTVNGTTVNLKDAVFDGNAWQDVNVDSGVGVENDSVLNIGTGCTFNNQYQITSDGQIVDGKHTTKYGTVNLNDSSKVLDVNDVEVGEGDSKYTKRFWTVSDKPAPAPTPEPEDPITNTGSGDNASTNVDASDNTTTSDSGKTETTIDSALGDKIVENAKDNNVADVVIKAETEKGDSTGSTVALPESTVQALAKDTKASVTIKTDSAEVSLDKAAVDAVAAQAGTDGEVKLVVETVENTEDTLKVELKLVTSKGTVTDFQGGNVTVTVPVSEELAGKKLVCVYIDDNDKYIMMDGALAADGKTFTFTTGHFSTYAILSEDEANAAIDGQDISKASVSGIANKTYTGKAVTQKLTVKAGDKGLVEGTDYTVSYSKNVNVGVASVKITGKGKYEGTLTKTFKINPKGTSISKVTGQKKAVKVVWKKQLTKMKSSCVSGYQVQYSTSSKFTAGTSKYANAKFSKGRTTKTIKNLKSGKKYYVRVRTYKTVDGTKCYSSWSSAKSVKTK